MNPEIVETRDPSTAEVKRGHQHAESTASQTLETDSAKPHKPKRTRPRQPLTVGMPTYIDRFQILRPLGSGGMSVVYEAYDDRLRRAVALKLLQVGSGKRRKTRLQREAQALARLSHPNVIEVYESGCHKGTPFIVMELVQGQPLSHWLRAKTRSTNEIIKVFIQAAHGLEAAHAVGLVHRDFKPSNVMVGRDGRVRVFDFGLACPSTDASGESSRSLASNSFTPFDHYEELWEQTLTRTGAVMGTPAYMSPEQFNGEAATEASDQFSFCVALFEALFGEHPFADREHWKELHERVTQGRLREPSPRHKVPTSVRQALIRGLATQPELRWTEMNALGEVLARSLQTRSHRWQVAGLAGLLALSGGATFALGGTASACSGAEDKVAEVWGADRKDELRQAMLDTKLSYAEQTWDKVEDHLDRYASSWSEAYQRACEVTENWMQSEQQMDRQMLCLERRRRAMGTLVEVMAAADGTAVMRAVGAVNGLSEVDDCLALEGASDHWPKPSDPRIAQQVEEQRHALERVKALDRTGKYQQGLDVAQQVAAKARQLGHPWLQASADYSMGWLELNLSQSEKAEQHFESAYFTAREFGHEQVALGASLQLAWLVGAIQDRPDEGLQWAQHAKAEVERDGRDEAQGWYLNVRGMVLSQAKRHKEALEHFQQSLTITRELLGSEHLHNAPTLNNMGLLLLDLHRTDEALVYLLESLSIRREALGDEHPQVAKMLLNVAAAHLMQGRTTSALDGFRRAHALTSKVLGTRHHLTAHTLSGIGDSLVAQGHHEQAEAHHRKALVVLEELRGPSSIEAARVHSKIAQDLFAQQRYEQAIRHHTRALRVYEGQTEDIPAKVCLTYLDLARAKWAIGLTADALSYVDRSLKCNQVTLNRRLITKVASARFALARELWAGQHHQRATALAEQATREFAAVDRSFLNVDELTQRNQLVAWLQSRDQ